MSGKSTLYKTCSGKPKAPICPYCGAASVFHASSAALYHGRDYGPLWICTPCGAWVGCHPGRQIALGRLANKELRLWKMNAHAAFDPLWKAKIARNRATGHKPSSCRRQGYQWLAQQLGIDPKDCHIGEFDVDTCRKVVEICTPHLERLRERAA